MTKVGAQRAADLTGRSKSTIQRAMTAGKLSYETDETGHRLIDVSELERLFGLKPDGAVAAESVGSEEAQDCASEDRDDVRSLGGSELEVLRARVAALEAQLDEVRLQRDAWQAQAQDAVATCQAAQKQVDVFAETIRERDRKEDERRRQIIEARANRAAGKPARPASPVSADNQNLPTDEIRSHSEADRDEEIRSDAVESDRDEERDDRQPAPESGGLLDFHGLWQRIKMRAGAA